MIRRIPYFIRKRTGPLVGRLRLRIRSGPNEGSWWSLASAGRGAIAGTFEAERLDTILALLRRGDRVWDIGAHKGYVSMAVARRVGPEGHVHSFEPSQVNRDFLCRHIAWSGLPNVDVMRSAISDYVGEDRFGGKRSTVTFRLGSGDEVVPVTTIKALVDEGLPRPDVLKIDAESSEAAVLRGAEGILGEVGLVFVSIHGREVYQECREVLDACGFRCFESRQLAALSADAGAKWRGDPELVAVGKARAVADGELLAMSLFADPTAGRSV